MRPGRSIQESGFSSKNGDWQDVGEVFHTVEKTGRFFHTMENLFGIFPHNGKNVSTVWKNLEPRVPARGAAERRAAHGDRESPETGIGGVAPEARVFRIRYSEFRMGALGRDRQPRAQRARLQHSDY